MGTDGCWLWLVSMTDSKRFWGIFLIFFSSCMRIPSCMNFGETAIRLSGCVETACKDTRRTHLISCVTRRVPLFAHRTRACTDVSVVKTSSQIPKGTW